MDSTTQPKTVDPTATEATPRQDGDSGAAAKRCSLCGEDVAHRWRVKHGSGYYCGACCRKRQELKESRKLALRNAIIAVAIILACVAILLLLHFMND